jgi:sec-independent protein translocase protein TatA
MTVDQRESNPCGGSPVLEDLFTPPHLLILFAILFFLFGAKRLPDLGKSLGHGIREFRGGIAGLSNAAGDEELPAATPTEPLAIAAPAEVADGETIEAVEGETVADSDDETVTAAPESAQRVAS